MIRISAKSMPPPDHSEAEVVFAGRRFSLAMLLIGLTVAANVASTVAMLRALG